jgi:hypothetical protein
LPERLLRWRKFDYLPGTECVAVQGHGHHQPRILRMGVQPRKELERAQKSKHPVLNEWKSCKEGAIVACLVKYYQVRYAMVVLLDKPVDESVITMQIVITQWTEDSANGRFEKYQELRDLHLQNTAPSCS